MVPSGSRSSCSPLCFISHRGALRRGFLFLLFNPPVEHPDELLHSQAMISCRTCTFSLRGRDYDVELALAVVQRTNPAATRLPFVPIRALCAWTPEGITHEDLRRYALNYLSNQYGLDTKQRGVDVQRVDGWSDMATHYVFVLFERGGDVPVVAAEKRSRFNKLRRLVTDLWHDDPYELSRVVYDRARIQASNPPQYFPSLAFEFLGVDEAAGERPVREEKAAALASIMTIMSSVCGHPSLLELPLKDGGKAPSSLSSSRSSSGSSSSSPSSSSSSSSFSSPFSPPPVSSATAAAGAATGNDVAMGTDEDAAGSGAAAARSFLEQLRGLPSDEKGKSFQAIRDGLAPGERFKLRAALGVAAPDEMTEGAVAARVAEELKNLVASMEADAATKGRSGVKGAKRFVTEDAVLQAADWEEDAARKRATAPVFMAVLEAALQAKSWYYDKCLMEKWVADAKEQVAAG